MTISGPAQRWVRRATNAEIAGYPWWLPMGVSLLVVIVTAAAVGQRGAISAPGWAMLGGAVAVLPYLVGIVTCRPFPTVAQAGFVLTGVGIMLLGAPIEFDMAPTVLMLMVACITAISSWRAGLAVAAASVVLLGGVALFAWLPDVVVNIAGICIAFDIGFTMRWQQRALEAERRQRRAEQQRSAEAERRHIAREVHDVVGHSLGVTLLHLQAARHALDTGDNTADAVIALDEAEQIGRQAMADIRRTVGLLAGDDHTRTSIPGVDDIDALVASVRAAGLPVDYRSTGPCPTSPITGLAVYRMVQESLANVAKHAPGSPVSLCLDFTDTWVRLSVTNTITHPAAPAGTGHGLTGMTTRAAQLGGIVQAGPSPDGQHWIVSADLPVAGAPTVETSSGGQR